MSATFKWNEIFKDLSLDTSVEADVVYLKFKDQIFGPILSTELEEYMQYLKYEIVFFKNKDEGDDSWKLMVHHPMFQRRKPDNVNKLSLPKDFKAFLLKNGRKDGPHSQDELNKLVVGLKILVTDFISIDSGKTWKRLCDYQQYDRRLYKHNHLPFTLNGKAPISLEKDIHNDSEEEIVKVAFHEHEETQTKFSLNALEEDDDSNQTQRRNYKRLMIVLPLLILIGIFIKFNKNIHRTFKKNIYSKFNHSKKVKSFKPRQRSLQKVQKNRSRKHLTRNSVKANNQKSILNSKAYKNRDQTGQDKDSENDVIEEYNNPYEQDQVQKMLTKENLYPEDFEDIDSEDSNQEEDDWVSRLEEESQKKRRKPSSDQQHGHSQHSSNFEEEQ